MIAYRSSHRSNWRRVRRIAGAGIRGRLGGRGVGSPGRGAVYAHGEPARCRANRSCFFDWTAVRSRPKHPKRTCSWTETPVSRTSWADMIIILTYPIVITCKRPGHVLEILGGIMEAIWGVGATGPEMVTGIGAPLCRDRQ